MKIPTRQIIEVHGLVQAQNLEEVQITAGTVVEKIQLTDRVAQIEKAQFLEWFKDRYENFGYLVGTAKQLADAVEEGLSGMLTPETLEIIIAIIRNI